MWTKYHYFLAVLMVITGSINTLSTNWADTTPARGKYGDKHVFDHPFLQACGMFLGEMLCFVAFGLLYFYNKRQHSLGLVDDSAVTINKFPPYIFLAPAMCDMLGTSTMYVGLTLTNPSSFQMLRGAVIIFTGLLSVAFLGRSLKSFHWLGMFFILFGLFLVGISDFISGGGDKNVDTNGVITGDLLIITAQIIVAVQMVIEEKFVSKHNVAPLLAVGFEGLFGFTVLAILLIPMYHIKVGDKFGKNPDHRLEDALDGFEQLRNSWIVSLATFGNILSIAFFNFAGISVTKEMSATTRMVLDSLRTIIIWVVSLAVGWQTFYFLQVIGFIFLTLGMCVYNDIVVMPYLRSRGWCLWSAGSSSPSTATVESPNDGVDDTTTRDDADTGNFPSDKANLVET